jgi:acyl-phosphate glycerol 3-phosphate acyltransferase
MNALSLASAALLSYLVGAVPFGYLIARWNGVDILARGSGNIGATNVGRILGRHWGVLVFLLDCAKGALPVLAALLLAPSGPDAVPPEALAVTAGIAAFLGHLFPVWLRFRGGKGVATGAGVVLVLVPLPALAGLLAWVVLVGATRYVSLASVAAAALIAVLRLAVPDAWDGPARLVTLFCLLAVALVVVRHHANLRRLLSGRENRLQDTPAMLTLTKTLHVLCLGLWFGSVVFFTLTGLLLFRTFDELSARPATERPAWFPAAYDGPRPSEKFPEPLRREQGLRAAGQAATPLFPWYYGLQAVCALVTAVIAVSWAAQRGGAVNKARAWLLVLALVTVGVGLWLEQKVGDLRTPRNELSDAAIADPGSAEKVAAAEAARASFGMWHGFSLLQNFATLLLVGVALALAAALPAPAAAPADSNGQAGAGRTTGTALPATQTS